MRSIVALCLIALVCASAAQTHRSNKNTKVADTKSILAELDQSKFGKTILSFLHLQNAGDVDVSEVASTLDDLLNQLQNRQADADANNQTNQALCDEILSNFASQLATERATVQSLENAITSNEEIRDQAKRDLELAATDYDETVAALESGEAQREGEHAKWVDVDYEHEEASVAIEETIKLIKHLIHGVSFAQIKPRYEAVQEKLRKTSKFSTLFKPLILSLSELATKLNYEDVVRILDLLNNILSALRQSQTDYRVAEENAEKDWDNLSSHLTDQKQALAEKRSRLNSLISSTEEILEQSRDSLSFHTQIQIKLETAEEEQENWCEDVSELYVDETNERARQTEVLERLNEHVNDKWGSVTEYLQTRRV